MPLTVRDATLLGFGTLFAGAATFFYKRKQTTPFKVIDFEKAGSTKLLVFSFFVSVFIFVRLLSLFLFCLTSTPLSLPFPSPPNNPFPLPQLAYFFAWPTLGSAIILVGMPSDEKLKRELSKPEAELAARGAEARAAAAAAVARGRQSQ